MPRAATDDVHGGLGLELGERPVVAILVEQGVGKLVGEGLHPLDRRVPDFYPDAAFGVRAVAVEGPVEPVVLDHEAERLGDGRQSGEVTCGVVTDEPAAHRRQLLALGLRDVEDGHKLEAADLTLCLAICSAVPPVDHGSEDPDGLLACTDEAVELAPGLETRHLGRLVTLRGDEEHVVEAVAVEAALELQITPPFVRGREIGDPLGELSDDLPVLQLRAHFFVPPCRTRATGPETLGGATRPTGATPHQECAEAAGRSRRRRYADP